MHIVGGHGLHYYAGITDARSVESVLNYGLQTLIIHESRPRWSHIWLLAVDMVVEFNRLFCDV
jgi:hypothetical protein